MPLSISSLDWERPASRRAWRKRCPNMESVLMAPPRWLDSSIIPMARTAPRRAVITGGAGFIGSHLCERFLAEGYEVVCVDNLITGRPKNVEHVFDEPLFTFIGSDVSAGIEVEGPVWAILHFASPASPIDY